MWVRQGLVQGQRGKLARLSTGPRTQKLLCVRACACESPESTGLEPAGVALMCAGSHMRTQR